MIAVGSYFEVDMGARGITRISNRSKHITLINNLTRKDVYTTEMAIEGFITIAVIDYNQIAIAIDVPSGKGDGSRISSKNA